MEEEDDPYESLPPSTPMHHHMMAGSVAGIAEHCLMYPVDVVKTRMMCIKGNPETQYKSITDALRTIVRTEGWMRPVRGVPAVFCGAGPAHAMYFAGYEKIKRELTLKFTMGKPGEAALPNACAGLIATLLHDAVMNPAEVVKQRMQMFQSPYQSCRDCLKQVYQSEGVLAFYRSYTTALTMNIPFQVTHFVVYEKMQNVTNRERSYNWPSHIMSGAVAGGTAAAITTPLDVCRTLLNTQQGLCTVPHCSETPLSGGPGISLNNTRTAKLSGMIDAIKIVHATGGLAGFFRGWRPRVMYQMPATGISWACYEAFKHFLVNDNADDGGDSSLTLQSRDYDLNVKPLVSISSNTVTTSTSSHVPSGLSKGPLTGAGIHPVCAASGQQTPPIEESVGTKPLCAHSAVSTHCYSN